MLRKAVWNLFETSLFSCFWANFSERISLFLIVVLHCNGFFFSLRLLYWWNIESLSFAAKENTLFLLIWKENFFLRTSHLWRSAAGKNATSFTLVMKTHINKQHTKNAVIYWTIISKLNHEDYQTKIWRLALWQQKVVPEWVIWPYGLW